MSRRSSLSRIKLSRDFKVFWTFSISLAVCLLVGVIFQFNFYIHQNTLAKSCQKKIASLKAENEELAVSLSQSNSLDSFNKRMLAQISNYEKVDIGQIRYLRQPGSEIVKN